MKKGKMAFRCAGVFIAITLLWAESVRSDTDGEKIELETLRIPLRLSRDPNNCEQGWKMLEFKNRPANKVASDEKGLHIKVHCSASLLVYGLEDQTDVNSVVVDGAVTGLPRIAEGKEQGCRNADDFAIRFGLVVPGRKRLNPLEKLFAPELVRHLFEQAPNARGLDHVLFLNMANDPPPEWRKRNHRIGNGLLRERIVCLQKTAGEFRLEAEFEEPLDVLALCIICDGDHTQSEFQVTVKDIRLNPRRRKEQ
jgi:hypothetical protein